MNYSFPNFRNVSVNITKDAMDFLCGTTKERCNLTFFCDIFSQMKLTDTECSRHGVSYIVRAGQADLPILTLADRWGIGRKACRNFLTRMEDVKLIRIRSDRTKPVIDLVCVGGWFLPDGTKVLNPFYLYARPNSNQIQKPTADSPP